MKSEQDRKLTTILCADVVGYSRLMSEDEEKTLERLKQTREIFKRYIEEYSGRIVNMTGDGLVADFASDTYVRLIVGQEEIDISDYSLITSSVAEAGLAEFTLKCIADDDVANSGHYGYAIITVDEP